MIHVGDLPTSIHGWVEWSLAMAMAHPKYCLLRRWNAEHPDDYCAVKRRQTDGGAAAWDWQDYTLYRKLKEYGAQVGTPGSLNGN